MTDWLVQVIFFLINITGSLVIVVALLFVAYFSIERILLGIMNLIGIKFIYKEFTDYFRNRIKNGNVDLPPMLENLMKIREKVFGR